MTAVGGSGESRDRDESRVERAGSTPRWAAIRVRTGSVESTWDLARRLGERLRGGEVVALVGELGAGKTAFVRGLAQGLGVADGSVVTSPTFVIEQVYEGRVELRHLDAYRLSGVGEIEALGFGELPGLGRVVAVEWADRVEDSLPSDTLFVQISLAVDAGPDERLFELSGPAGVWRDRLEGLDRAGDAAE